MEKVLQKLAQTLVSFDEASALALWEKYDEKVQHFEPTKRWEEAVLILSFIQALRWKNMLFNHHWAEWSQASGARPPEPPVPGAFADDPLLRGLTGPEPAESGPAGPADESKRCKVLRFRTREDDESV